MTLPVTPATVAAAVALLAAGVFAGVQIGKSDRPVKKYPAPNPTVTQRLAEPQYEEEAQPIEEEGGYEDPGYYEDEDSGYEEGAPMDDQGYEDSGASVVCPDWSLLTPEMEKGSDTSFVTPCMLRSPTATSLSPFFSIRLLLKVISGYFSTSKKSAVRR